MASPLDILMQEGRGSIGKTGLASVLTLMAIHWETGRECPRTMVVVFFALLFYNVFQKILSSVRDVLGARAGRTGEEGSA